MLRGATPEHLLLWLPMVWSVLSHNVLGKTHLNYTFAETRGTKQYFEAKFTFFIYTIMDTWGE